jgi:ribosomal protein S18 acetylase RimI-like enzyme
MRRDDDEVVTIERAEAEDAPFVAWTVLTALDMTADDLRLVTECCADAEAIYSWRRAWVAKAAGRCVGCLVAYDGADYASRREYTWRRLWADDDADLSQVAMETEPGEFYLDSMAVLPEFRGREIGKKLIRTAISHAEALGFRRFSIIVDVGKPCLFAYYRTLGFAPRDVIPFFGHSYNRLLKTT